MGLTETTPPLQSSGNMDYDEFVVVMKYLLDASWGENWGAFTPDNPNVTDAKNIKFPIIVHYLNELQPGVVGKGTKEIKPRYRYLGKNSTPDRANINATTIYGQMLDAEVVFEVWGETNGEVNEMTKRLRQTINAFTGYLKEKGLHEIQFLKMEPDLGGSKMNDSYKIRKLRYFIKFEEITEVPSDIFRIFDVVDKKLQEETKNRI